MSSARRMLAILGLFTADHPILTAEEIVARLGCSRPTGYRYIRELCGVGLLNRFAGAYMLGSRIIELDYCIRQCDPILQASQPVMRELQAQCGCDILLLRAFGERIVAIHHERGVEPMTLSFGRGRPMPLFRSAGSKVILATLPGPRQRRLFLTHRAEIAAAGLGRDWDAFRAALGAIRKAGHAISFGELDPGNIAVAAPLLHGREQLSGSLVMVMSEARYALADKALLVAILIQASNRIGVLIKQLQDPRENRVAVLPATPRRA